MKKLSIIIALFTIIVSCKGNENKPADSLAINSTKSDQNKLKRYQVKSGIIHYTSTISGKVLGNTMSGTGTESVYFKDWGAIELRDEKSTETSSMKFFGKTKKETTNKRVINKLDNGEWYIVDFDRKEITATRSLPIDAITAFHPESDAGDTGKQMVKGLGGKKIGEETFMGYNCEIWEALGVKQWVYKHITLKIESTVLGVTTSKKATSIKFNISVPDSHFKLPDFPIVKQESFLSNDDIDFDMEDIDANLEKVGKLSYSEWKKMALADKDDEEMQNMSEEELRQTYDMIQKMVKMRKGN
ncbi:hypothetical protein SAMN05444411_101163 [Lutibacter oricola]|uniref:Uncharacterized protein n=1 Tax=Lutibacter oricola TaxID=762486 RepID=A0A1H2R6J5_9FLAO|nr:hypothetical protein [Lutibacter oricola]SDW15017.1 hypothetical protein SAMN05444411_101163 [Lutibacter oricola]